MPFEVSTAGARHDREPTVEELKQELAEAHRREAATADVLKIISRSAFDLQAVLDALVESAARLCAGDDVSMFRLEGDTLRRVAHCGSMRGPIGYVIPAISGSVAGKSVLERRPIHVTDLQAETQDYPEGSAAARELGHRTIIVVPLLRQGAPLGAISLRRNKVEPFSDKQIELVTTFADQAVIAIENTRLFEEVQARTRELTEALQYQTATSEVLGVISRSQTTAQPVFDIIAKSALRLASAQFSTVILYDGEMLRLAAYDNANPEGSEVLRRTFPQPPNDRQTSGRALASRTAVQIPDVLEDVNYDYKNLAQALGFRSTVAVPMLRDGEPIGAIGVGRVQPGAFPDKEVELLQTFADQAVIAIENTRLFEAEQTRSRELTERTQELTESLEYQTATSDVLNVISRSPSELQPVLDTIVKTAGQICKAQMADIAIVEGARIRIRAGSRYVGGPTGQVRALDRATVMGRAVLDASPVHIIDMQSAGDDFRAGRELAVKYGHRTILGVPLMRERRAVGALILRRNEAK